MSKSTWYIEVDSEGNPVSHLIAYTNLQKSLGNSEIGNDDLLRHNYVPVEDNFPTVEKNQRIENIGFSKKEDGTWSQNWKVITLDGDYLLNTWIRIPRIQLLKDSDWALMPDSPLSEEEKAKWITYRETLRKLPDVYASNPTEVVFPVRPDFVEPSV